MRSPKVYTRFLTAGAIWAAASAAYFLWEALSYRGFYVRLAEFQIMKLGAFAPFLTYLILLGCAVLPVLLVSRLLRPSDDGGASDPSAGAIERAKRLRVVLFALSGTAVAGAGAFAIYASLFLPTQQGKMQTIAVSEVATLAVKEGPARLVGGELGTIVFFGHEWFIGDERMAFAPYRSVGASDGVTRVFIELEAQDQKALKAIGQRPAWSGIIVEGQLPGTARALFNSIGVGVSEPYYTLYRTERALKIGYWLQAAQWFILAAFLGFMAFLQSRRIRRLVEDMGTVPA